MENKIERNIEYIQNIIEKYEFLKSFKRSIEKIKENPDLNKINDLLRLISSILEEKIDELKNELKTKEEKIKAIQEEFSTKEYENLKQQNEELNKQIENLKNELEQSENKYQELMDKYQKLSIAYREIKTEYENHIYRTEKNYQKLKRESKERIITNLIPVIDSFEISLKSIKNTQNIEEIIKGIELIYLQFIEALKNEGLEIIKSQEGEKFDPSIHEAIEIQETEEQDKDSTIYQEYRPAYKLMDKILRPASVKVFKSKKQSEV